jgi:hypothetical protein
LLVRLAGEVVLTSRRRDIADSRDLHREFSVGVRRDGKRNFVDSKPAYIRAPNQEISPCLGDFPALDFQHLCCRSTGLEDKNYLIHAGFPHDKGQYRGQFSGGSSSPMPPKWVTSGSPTNRELDLAIIQASPHHTRLGEVWQPAFLVNRITDPLPALHIAIAGPSVVG